MPEHTRQWRTLDLLKVTEEHFREKKIDEARLHAEILLAHVLQESRMDLYLNYDRPVEQPQLEAFRVLCRDRLKGRPLQYITGEQIFYGYSFSVDERVLIPRPETELLFEYALERWQAGAPAPESGPEILDIGTGSGCLAVLFAITVPDARITAVDVSAEALEIAALNAEKHGVTERIRFVQSDALHPGFSEKLAGRYDLIVSNPPYIPESEWSALQKEVKEYEPKIALTISDGFAFYHAITRSASALLRAGGVLCFELHADGASVVSGSMRDGGYEGIAVQKDYAGLDRVISGALPV
ncbi:MAG: peptide chain release factor N(5)-glutamine methyltransferase [Chlorobium phaeobacteroides]|uniref:Release factor glutamine methyltransferase n=1 Tax=Chlorobium phaeobacteroides (strain BS1) TaxID=331678 RepID=B3EPC4_CHLPB|nr:peptide chain release factor N(5)-glutamine methyltransferase [Chlorobium phaeobacteroides]NEX13169.1 peptide chain release factor N(5)-glutamine methyltransferase [Prosthecochloris sp.]